MTRGPFKLLAAIGLAAAFFSQIPAQPAMAQSVVYLSSTDDVITQNDESCVPGQPCPLRTAIRTAQREANGAIVRACFDPAEVPGALPCPPGGRPLRKSDKGYDPVEDRWIIKIKSNLPIEMNAKQTFVDLRQGLDWKSPADNKIVIDAGDLGLDHLFAMDSDRNILAGFEIRGSFLRSAILIRGGRTRDESRNNQIGPGIIFAKIPHGAGLHIKSADTSNNKFIGNWCGITGDGTVISPLTDDCVFLEQGTYGNVIGDASPAGRNIFAATTAGSGVRIEDSEFVGLNVQTRQNVIEYNWFGLDAKEQATGGLDSGIIFVWSPFNTVRHNVISNSRNAGIGAFNVMTGTIISDNIIGGDSKAEGCRGNKSDGVLLVSGPSGSVIERNQVVCNQGNGITLQGANTRDNLIRQNTIRGIVGKPISILSDANRKIRPPKIVELSSTQVSGTTCVTCTVEIFSDANKQAQFYEGSVEADASGNWSFEPADGFRGRYVTASTTDVLNSSELAAAVLVPNGGGRSPTPTNGPPTWTPDPKDPTPSPTATTAPTSGPRSYVYLPVLAKAHESLGQTPTSDPLNRIQIR
jgi:hypothetical protein